MVDRIGHDKRGTTIFKRDKQGNEILVQEDNVIKLDTTSKGMKTITFESMVKVIDDQTPLVIETFLKWKKQEGISW
jgi:type I restriction enzyme M protein